MHDLDIAVRRKELCGQIYILERVLVIERENIRSLTRKVRKKVAAYGVRAGLPTWKPLNTFVQFIPDS